MRVFEFARIGPFARRFQFNESHERLVNGDGVVRPRLQIADGRFAHGGDGGLRETGQLSEVREQLLRRRAELILRFAARAGIGKLGFGFGPERGHCGVNGGVHSMVGFILAHGSFHRGWWCAFRTTRWVQKVSSHLAWRGVCAGKLAASIPGCGLAAFWFGGGGGAGPPCAPPTIWNQSTTRGRGRWKMAGLQRDVVTARLNSLELILSRTALAATSLIWKRLLLSTFTKFTIPPASTNGSASLTVRTAAPCSA